MQSYFCAISLCFVLFVFGIIVHGEPEPMARPTRPEVFTNPEELRRYLDHISDYYSLSGKARYGKRGSILSSTSDVNHVLDTMKAVLDNSQLHRPKFVQQKQETRRFFSDLESPSNKNYDSRIDGQPCHVVDIV